MWKNITAIIPYLLGRLSKLRHPAQIWFATRPTRIMVLVSGTYMWDPIGVACVEQVCEMIGPDWELRRLPITNLILEHVDAVPV